MECALIEDDSLKRQCQVTLASKWATIGRAPMLAIGNVLGRHSYIWSLSTYTLNHSITSDQDRLHLGVHFTLSHTSMKWPTETERAEHLLEHMFKIGRLTNRADYGRDRGTGNETDWVNESTANGNITGWWWWRLMMLPTDNPIMLINNGGYSTFFFEFIFSLLMHGRLCSKCFNLSSLASSSIGRLIVDGLHTFILNP